MMILQHFRRLTPYLRRKTTRCGAKIRRAAELSGLTVSRRQPDVRHNPGFTGPRSGLKACGCRSEASQMAGSGHLEPGSGCQGIRDGSRFRPGGASVSTADIVSTASCDTVTEVVFNLACESRFSSSVLAAEERWARAGPEEGSSSMFIPRGLYDSAPYYWLVGGIILLVLGTYLAASVAYEHYVLGLIGGSISCAWGLWVFRQRLSRRGQPRCSTCGEYLERASGESIRP